jgi:hypothetical protein
MYTLFEIVKLLASLVIIVAAADMAFQWWKSSGSTRRHSATKGDLSDTVFAPEVGHEEHVPAQEANAKNLAFGGVANISVGHVLLNLPQVDPTKPARNDATILAIARVIAYLRKEEVHVDLVFCDKGILTGVIGGKPRIFGELSSLTDPQKDSLQKERQQAVDSGDMLIPNLLGDGKDFAVVWAAGSQDGTKPGDPECSYIQLTGLYQNIGGGFDCPVAPALLDRKPHHYYDVIAKDDTGRLLYAFYAGEDGWRVYLGRTLDEVEAKAVNAL